MKRHAARLLLLAVLVLNASPAYAAQEVVQNGRPSGNWAGYVASRDSYSGVGATWVVPEVMATTTLMSDVAWVGIGGSKTKDLIQAGTHGAVQNGTTQYWAWYELLPAYQVVIPVAVTAGDEVEVALAEVARNLWYLSFVNNTTGQTYYTTLEYRSKHSSAEWIEEMPNVYDRDGVRLYAPLSEFKTVAFRNAYAIVDGERKSLADIRASAVSMVAKNNKRLVLAAPSELSEGGSFVVERSGAVPSPMTKELAKRHKASMYDIVWSAAK